LGFALAMDGLLGSCQGLLKKQRKNYRAPDAMETMLYVNLYAILFLLPTALYTGHWKNGMELLMQEDSEFPLIFLLLNGMAAAGQICIFFTIHLYSPLMCTTITTTRKFITVFLSVQKFRHAFSPIEWSCVAFVFGGVYLEIASKVKTAPPPPSTTKKLQ
jgi:UDP-galactose transporter B1